ncbi:hypothetical protein ABIC64_002243 [Plantibacter flavus]
MTERRGIVRINDHVLELPEAEARQLLKSAVAASRNGRPLPISPDTSVLINQATQISLTITDGFLEPYEAMLRTHDSR